MGSHSGATDDGQREVLASLGITEDKAGASITSRYPSEHLSTVTVSDTEISVYFSAVAFNADAVLVVSRVKAHTNFSGPVESGLSKMTVVGLDKQRGAKSFHSTTIGDGDAETLQTALYVIESNTPLLGGSAFDENF